VAAGQWHTTRPAFYGILLCLRINPSSDAITKVE
jgi:hypothetical protein